MSSSINDENTDDLHSQSPVDSGYFSFTSPSRLSPSHVLYTQQESPISEHDLQSPVKLRTQKFVSNMDYENYITTRKYFDILSQLDHRNVFHLLDQIFDNLSTKDCISCLLVGKRWNSIIKDVRRRRQTKNVKRNLFNETTKLTSTPMQNISNKISSKSILPLDITAEEECLHLTASAMTFRYGYLKYLHGPTIPKRCPICSFVSIVDINDQHGICTNPLCRNSFCQCCSGPYHPSSPCKTSTGPIRSPWRKRISISPIFSNKTRNNLRRLLLE